MLRIFIGIFLAVWIIAAASSCTSIRKDGQYYYDQKILTCQHDPEHDGKNFQIYKFAVYIPADQKVKEINDSMIEAVKATGNNFLNITSHEVLKKKATVNGQTSRMDNINSTFYKTGFFPEQEMQAMGKKLKYDYLVVPIIRNISINDQEAYSIIEDPSEKGDYYWPEFGVIENEKTGTIEVEIHIFDVNDGKFLEKHTAHFTIHEFYDTPELYQKKMLAIDKENRLRIKENNYRREKEEEERRERERERREEERERAKSKPDGFDIFMDVLDIAVEIASEFSDYELKMVSRPQFRQSAYRTQSDIESELIKNSISNAFGKYMSRFDGITYSGITTTGTGVFIFINGDIYDGQWENSKAHGTGIYKYSNGAEYNGSFVEGYAQGQGIYKDNDSNIFEGGWEDGEKHGKGEYTFHDGTKTSAVCDRGKYVKMTFKKKVDYKDKMKYTKYIRGRIGRSY